MIDTLKELAKARQHEEDAKKAKLDALAEFKASPFYQALLVNHALAVAKAIELTEQLCQDAITIYDLDGEKKPSHGGYEIKFNTCDDFRPVLKTDTKLVEKATKYGNISTYYEEIIEKPKVFIKKDLSGFLK